VPDWRDLAHRDQAALEAAGLRLHLDTRATAINVADHRVRAVRGGHEATFRYDQLLVATGALPVRPPITGLDTLGPADGVHLLHSTGDALAVAATLEQRQVASAVIVGGGYIGLEMAEALIHRGMTVTMLEALPQLMSTVDPQIAAEAADTLRRHGIQVHTRTAVTSVERDGQDLRCMPGHTMVATGDPGERKQYWSSPESAPTPGWPPRPG
jgi:NADPH-dependent 2,4-dienoyl-CoA reductase/sulfur reductase-like enzyme